MAGMRRQRKKSAIRFLFEKAFILLPFSFVMYFLLRAEPMFKYGQTKFLTLIVTPACTRRILAHDFVKQQNLNCKSRLPETAQVYNVKCKVGDSSLASKINRRNTYLNHEIWVQFDPILEIGHPDDSEESEEKPKKKPLERMTILYDNENDRLIRSYTDHLNSPDYTPAAFCYVGRDQAADVPAKSVAASVFCTITSKHQKWSKVHLEKFKQHFDPICFAQLREAFSQDEFDETTSCQVRAKAGDQDHVTQMNCRFVGTDSDVKEHFGELLTEDDSKAVRVQLANPIRQAEKQLLTDVENLNFEDYVEKWSLVTYKTEMSEGEAGLDGIRETDAVAVQCEREPIFPQFFARFDEGSPSKLDNWLSGNGLDDPDRPNEKDLAILEISIASCPCKP